MACWKRGTGSDGDNADAVISFILESALSAVQTISILPSEPQISIDDRDNADSVIRVTLESALSAVQTVSFGLKLRRRRDS